MRFSTNGTHCDFFGKNHYIAFEEILSPTAIDALNAQIDSVLAKRLRITLGALENTKASSLFQAGYDLWREEEKIKKATHKLNLVAIASELFKISSLRIAFDQFLATPLTSDAPFSHPTTLQESSCLNPLAGALVIQLTENSPLVEGFPLPAGKGTALFLAPEFVIDWPALFAAKGLRFLLIAFGKDRTLFRADTQDPHAVALKKLGYVFGDRLSDSLHPYLIRK